MRWWLQGLVWSAVFMCAPAQGASTKYAQVGNWSINQTENESCSAVLAYDEISVALVYDAKTGHVFLFLGNTNATSLVEDQSVSLQIIFTRGSYHDEGWGEEDFTVHLQDGLPVLVSKGWFSIELLDDFSKNEYFMALNDGKLVSGAKLTQSAAMVSKLRQCSFKAAKVNPKDPFVR